jgi:hypothetical protein
VRVEAARLRTKLREYYDREGRDDPVRLELPKGRYAVQFEERGAATTVPVAPHPPPIEDTPSQSLAFSAADKRVRPRRQLNNKF